MRLLPTLVLLAAVAVADEVAKRGRDYFTGWLRYGNTDRLVSGFGSLDSDLARSPAYTREVCAMAAECVGQLDRSDKDKCRELAEKMVGLAELAQGNAADNEDAGWAWAEASLFRVRMLRLIDDKETGPAQLQEVALSFLALADKTKESARALLRGADILFEASQDEKADRPALLEKIESTRKRAVEAGFGTVADAISVSLGLDEARALLAKGDRKATKDRLKACLGTLKPHLKAKDADPGMVARYTDLVSFARADKKLGMRPKYRTKQYVAGHELAFDLPISPRLSFSRSAVKGRLGTIRQLGPDGRTRRTINMYRYDPNVTYTLDGKGFSGDNLKGLAMIGLRDVKSVVVDVKKEKKIRKGRFAKRAAQSFTVGGYAAGNRYLAYHCYIFKAKSGWAYKVMVLELGDLPSVPEIGFVLDSFRIRK